MVVSPQTNLQVGTRVATVVAVEEAPEVAIVVGAAAAAVHPPPQALL
jgi:hypothetical protein